MNANSSFLPSKDGYQYPLPVGNLHSNWRASHWSNLVIFVDDHAHFDLTGIDVDDNGRLNVVDLDVPSRSGETEAPAQDDDYNVSDLFDACPAALYNTTLFLTTAEEASLFRHFLEKLGPWVRTTCFSAITGTN